MSRACRNPIWISRYEANDWRSCGVVSGSRPSVLVNQAAEPLVADDPSPGHHVLIGNWNLEAQATMWPGAVVVIGKFRDDRAQVALTEDEDPVQRLAPGSLDPALGD